MPNPDQLIQEVKAYAYGLLPYSSAGLTTSIPLPKKLTETASKIGIPLSAEEIMGKVADKMVTSNYGMVHAVSRTNNSVTYKPPKTPSSKSKAYVGPSSWQDLLDGDKWREWWNGGK